MRGVRVRASTQIWFYVEDKCPVGGIRATASTQIWFYVEDK
jgi:hypothetical protein